MSKQSTRLITGIRPELSAKFVVEFRYVGDPTRNLWNKWIEENAKSTVHWGFGAAVPEGKLLSTTLGRYLDERAFTVIRYAFDDEKDAIHFKLRFG